MTEMLDIYDENLNHLGIKDRVAVHQDGDWHRVFHCWVIYRDETGHDWLILQKRAADRPMYPNLLDISAAGHYMAGETPSEGVRELNEELGLDAKLEDLISLGVRITVGREGALVDYGFADVYFYVCDQALADYDYQKSEISGLIALEISQGLRLLSGEIAELSVAATGFSTDTITITAQDFIPSVDRYFQKILVLAKRCLDGEAHLYI